MSGSDFTICLMTVKHVNDVRQWLMNSFLIDEPLNQRLQFDLSGKPQDFMDYTTQQAVRGRCSFVTIDSVTNKTVDFILNELQSRNGVDGDTGDEFE
ncbi:unnamed protein product [Rotaria socialis]|uniref:Uncharacterized protein n=1 Tax=Rotaria socialis TaxID=392032 RepID=A0A819YCL7_9BILA|nr:unnamed protein product [Rotaria socialis]CAF4152945.1 unnamed protein product [Rotaria socialis]CAF4417596.1 unnamed protein product [Rotaria socialis]